MALALTVLLIACKKKDGDNVNLDPSNQQWYDFMSSQNGSYWRYASRDGLLWNRYAREMDTMVLGKKYRYYERKDDASGGYDPEYFGKNNSLYLTLIDLDGSRSNYIDYVYWRDGAKKGDTYRNTGDVNSPVGKVQIEIETYVADDNLTLTHGNLVFQNVIHAHSDIKGTAGILLPNVKVGTLDVWFVKGIGIIREEANIDIMGQYKQRHIDSLIEYKIVP